MTDIAFKRVQTVSEITRSIKGILETGFNFVNIIGEISNLRIPASGHVYFTLKDQEAQIKAVLFKTQRRYSSQIPRNGQEVICRGRISVYEPRGEYQIIVDAMDFHGAGALQQAFEKLKHKLAAEGLFDETAKKTLPFFPKRVALVTAPTGAAIHDFLKIARKRHAAIPIDIFAVRVQGKEASGEIAAALNEINRMDNHEVIVLCRGGGSIEDLWAFNEEIVARAIYHSKIPVVSAVGHEIDYTIADFVADYRAPTPTAAAEAVIPDRIRLLEKILTFRKYLINSIESSLAEFREKITYNRRILGDPTLALSHYILLVEHRLGELAGTLSNSLSEKIYRLREAEGRLHRQNPGQHIILMKQRILQLENKLHLVTKHLFQRKQAEFTKSVALLDSVSPLSVLTRGYSISLTVPEGSTVTDAENVKIGDQLQIVLLKGKLLCEVLNTYTSGQKPD